MSSVIITGASDGIGKELAFEFARRGYSLGLIARRETLLESVKFKCAQLGSPQVFISATDVADELKFEEALDSLDKSLNGSDIFVANAGVGALSSNGPDAWAVVKKTLSINAMAAIHGLEHMKVKYVARKRGTLSGVSSIAGARGLPYSGSYSASKAALTVHLEALRVEMKAFGISVVTIAPGFIATAMTEGNQDQMPFLGTAEASAKVFVNGILKKKRWVVYPLPFRFIYPILQIIPRSIFDFVTGKLFANIK